MSIVSLSEHAKSVREWALGNGTPKVERLAFLEDRFPFLSDKHTHAERIYLLQSVAEERHHQIKSRIFNCHTPQPVVKILSEKIARLNDLSNSLKNDPRGKQGQDAFWHCPSDVQKLFYWAVWVHFGAPDKLDFGRDKLSKQLSLLAEIQSPLLFTSEKNLCDQALRYYETQCALEKQREILHHLHQISQKLKSAFPNYEELRRAISQLPHELQAKMHEDIHSFLPSSQKEAAWEERPLMKNPQSLLSFRLPKSTCACLLDNYIKEHEETLKRLEDITQIEEFERICVLFPSMNSGQRHALLHTVSAQARAFALEYEEEERQRLRREGDQYHLYKWRGAHPKHGGTAFQVFAPNASEVQLVLTAYGKEEHVIPMHRTDWGGWEIFTEHAHPGRTYRFRICDSGRNWGNRTDPFGRAIIETHGIAESVVPQIGNYPWKDRKWMKARSEGNPLKKPLSIYELNVDFWKRDEGKTISFRKLAHEIVEYHKVFPFTHVELYGVLDNKHDYSWGYQPDHFLAANRRLAENEDDFKFLVDLCHRHHIGVIIDWIPTHYKHDHAGDLSQSLHYYDGTNLFASEPSPWGTMFFDFGKEETRRLLLASALYWLEMNHVDGLRLDAVGPLLKTNNTVKGEAVDFLKELNGIVHHQYPGVVMIAEETDGFPNVTRPIAEGGLGFDIKVGVHLQYKMRNYFKTPYDERGWDCHHYEKLVAHLQETGGHERWMLAHSHDDAASGAQHCHSTLYSSMPTQDPWRRFADMRLFHAWNLLSPGAGHMIHMGDELGQIWAWNGRLHTREGAVEWHLLDHGRPGSERHRSLLEYVGDLNRLYLAKQAFWKHADWGFKPISHNATNKVIGFHRLDYEGSRLALFYNFSPMGYQEYDFPLPSLEDDSDLGWIRGAKEIFNSDGVQYGGTGNFRNQWAYIVRNDNGKPTHFRFALPPLSVLVFEEVWE